MIKKIIGVQIIGALLFIGAEAGTNTETNCDDLRGCEKKICSLEKDIAIAKKMKNSSRVNGLEISLNKVIKYCTNDNLTEEINNKIADAKEDLEEHTKDYKQALQDNRADKIQKYKVKVEEDNQKILDLQLEAEALQQ